MIGSSSNISIVSCSVEALCNRKSLTLYDLLISKVEESPMHPLINIDDCKYVAFECLGCMGLSYCNALNLFL